MQSETLTDYRVYLVRNKDLPSLRDPDISNRFALKAGIRMNFEKIPQEYFDQANRFGTTLTMDASLEEIQALMTICHALNASDLYPDLPYGLVSHFGYPIGDGKVIDDPVVTFFWMLIDANNPAMKYLTANLKLADFPPPAKPFTAPFQKQNVRKLEDFDANAKTIIHFRSDLERLNTIGGLSNAHAHHAGCNLGRYFAEKHSTEFLSDIIDCDTIEVVLPEDYIVDALGKSEEQDPARPKDIIIDPTYPLCDGFTRNVITAGWIYIEPNDPTSKELVDYIMGLAEM